MFIAVWPKKKQTLVDVDLTHYTYVKRMQMDNV